MVPSSPNGPCSSASATSTGPRWDRADCSRTASSLPLETRISKASAAFSLSSGSLPSVTASRLIVSGSTKIQRPVRVMPIPTTSKRSRSKALSTPAAVRHDTPCSLLVPPKTTATR